MSGFKVGDEVTWISSGTYKKGFILAVVPPMSQPKDAGYPKIDAGLPRDHESYIVRGQKLRYRNSAPSDKRSANYWPRVSLLEHV